MTGLSSVLPTLLEALPTLVTSVIETLALSIPTLAEGAVTLFTAIVDAIPTIVITLGESLPSIITAIVDGITNTDVLSQVLEGAVTLFTSIVTAIPDLLVSLATSLPDIITAIVDALVNAGPQVLTAAGTALGNVITAIANLIPNLDVSLDSILTSVTNVFTSVGTTIDTLMQTASGFVSTAIDTIVGFLDFDWSWPSIPLPHFSITGSINPLDWFSQGLPSISVEWYATGGVFDSPTLFSAGGGLAGIGEAGAEAVVPLEDPKNEGWTSAIADKIAAKIAGQPVVIEVDGKALGQTVINLINQNTIQTGKVGLLI